jgi:D-galactarolactone cycloisomerase
MNLATLHLAAALPDQTRVAGAAAALLELDTTENLLVTRLLQSPPVLQDGGFAVPSGPGLGIDVDESWIRAHSA